MKLSFILAASFFVTGKASLPFDLESSSELMACGDTDCYTLCEAAALDAVYDATKSIKDFDAYKVRFTINLSCNCGLEKCCNTPGLLVEKNAQCFGDDGQDECKTGNRACCCYYDGPLDLKMQDKLKADGPFLRAPVPELN